MDSSSAIITLSFSGESTSTPAFSGRKSSSVLDPRRAKASPASDNSKTMDGGGFCNTALRESSKLIPLSFDERDLVDFLQGAHALAHFLHRRFTQEGHAFVARLTLDLGGRPLVQNHFADLVAEVQQLVYGRPAAVARPAAFEASGAFHEFHVAPFRRHQARFHQERVGVLHLMAAVF